MIKTFCIAFLISLASSAQASYSQHYEYLSKILAPAHTFPVQFESRSLEPSREAWFEKADQLLNPSQLGTYRASFLLSFDQEGHIDALSIKSLEEDDLIKFKDFVASLLSLKFNSLPSSIDASEVFEMDGELLYLQRPRAFRTGSKSIELELVQPHYIDYPALGEMIKFRLEDGSILETKVSGIDAEFLYLSLASLNTRDQYLYQDMLLRIARPKKNSKSITATAIGAAMVSVVSTGFAASTLSYGIAPAALGLTSFGSSLVRGKEELVSFNISKGDRVVVERGETIRGEKQ